VHCADLLPADATMPAVERRNYKGIGDAFVRIVKEDGLGGLFRGASPTIARAMALNMGMFASNEQAKELLQARARCAFGSARNCRRQTCWQMRARHGQICNAWQAEQLPRAPFRASLRLVCLRAAVRGSSHRGQRRMRGSTPVKPCAGVQDNTSLRGLPLTASASMIAGFFAAACSLPFDFVKTRMQRMKPDAQGKVPYSGFVDCAAKVRASKDLHSCRW
jgi:Mitochondrial carrier protein